MRTDVTPFFLLAACVAAPPPSIPSGEAAAAVAYLRTLQTPSGGFVSVPPPAGTEAVPSLRTTRTGLRAFRLLGGSPADPDGVVRFLLACHDPKTGGFSDRPGAKPDAVSTAVGLMILGELKRPVEPYLAAALEFMGASANGFEEVRMVASALEETGRTVPQVAGWLRDIDRARKPDGSYGSGPGTARTTALNEVARQRLGGKTESPDAVLKALNTGRRPDGGFGSEREDGSDLEACYRIVRLYSRLGAVPDRPDELRAFVGRCRNPDGGFGVRPGGPSSLHGTYYAAIVRYWLDGGK
jgi:hypothetical protein